MADQGIAIVLVTHNLPLATERLRPHRRCSTAARKVADVPTAETDNDQLVGWITGARAVDVRLSVVDRTRPPATRARRRSSAGIPLGRGDRPGAVVVAARRARPTQTAYRIATDDGYDTGRRRVRPAVATSTVPVFDRRAPDDRARGSRCGPTSARARGASRSRSTAGCSRSPTGRPSWIGVDEAGSRRPKGERPAYWLRSAFDVAATPARACCTSTALGLLRGVPQRRARRRRRAGAGLHAVPRAACRCQCLRRDGAAAPGPQRRRRAARRRVVPRPGRACRAPPTSSAPNWRCGCSSRPTAATAGAVGGTTPRWRTVAVARHSPPT